MNSESESDSKSEMVTGLMVFIYIEIAVLLRQRGFKTEELEYF